MIRQTPCPAQNTGFVVCMNVWSLFYFFISATNSLAFATALVMWSQIWSSPISRSIFAFLRVACTGHTTHQFVELGGYPEEERAFYLVNFHAFGYFQDFVGSRFGSGRNIELVVEYRYLRGLCHAAQEEDNGQQQPDFDGDRKIEYNGKQEGDNEYRHV